MQNRNSDPHGDDHADRFAFLGGLVSIFVGIAVSIVSAKYHEQEQLLSFVKGMGSGLDLCLGADGVRPDLVVRAVAQVKTG